MLSVYLITLDKDVAPDVAWKISTDSLLRYVCRYRNCLEILGLTFVDKFDSQTYCSCELKENFSSASRVRTQRLVNKKLKELLIKRFIYKPVKLYFN